MKKLVIALFVIVLPVFAGNDPTDEREKKYHIMEKFQDLYHGIPWSHKREEYHTMKEFQTLPWSHKRKLASGLSTLSGVGVAMTSIVTAAGGDISGELGLVGTYLGAGLTFTGCYLAFWSPKE